MSITVHDFEKSDFERCLEIRIQNYKEVNKTPEKIPWVRAHFLSNLETRKYFVAKDWKLIIWIWGYFQNHLSTFFVDPKYQWKWVGKLLIKKVLSEIQKSGYKNANLNSSEYAKPFYEHFWFTVVENKEEWGCFMEKIF